MEIGNGVTERLIILQVNHPIIVKILSISVAEIYAHNTCQYPPTNNVYSPESSRLNPLSFPRIHFSQSFSNSVIFRKALINLPVEEECFKKGIACQLVSNHFLPLGTYRRPSYISISQDHHTSENAHQLCQTLDYNPSWWRSSFTESPHLLYNI